MASHGDISQGNQIFISIRRGSEWPANVFDIRVKYEETIGDLKSIVCAKLGIDREKLQLFHHKKELMPVSDCYTLAQMEMHTGFSLSGWDLSVTPDYWPSVKQGPDGGLMIDC